MYKILYENVNKKKVSKLTSDEMNFKTKNLISYVYSQYTKSVLDAPNRLSSFPVMTCFSKKQKLSAHLISDENTGSIQADNC